MSNSRTRMPSREGRLDGVAVVLSTTCMVHCFALPVVLTLFPILQGSLLEETYFHLVMLIVVLPTSVIALTVGCRRHKDPLTFVLGGLGLTILTMTALFGHAWFGFLIERVATSLGGVILASSHIRNYRCCRRHNCLH